MHIPTCSLDQALDQAGATAAQYVAQGISAIDRHLGEGYAKKHPELLAAVVQAQAADFHSVLMSFAVHEAGKRVEEGLGLLANELTTELVQHRPAS